MNRAIDIEREAAQWAIRLHAEDAASWQAAFDSWASADLRHRAAYLRLSTAWDRSARLRHLAPPGAAVDANLLRPTGHGWQGYFKAGYSVAAVLATILLVSVLNLRTSPGATTYRTEVGGYSRLPLPDGSTVSLNTNSEVRISFSHSARTVILVRGEALFEVAHDVRRPFMVRAGRSVVKAVGTSFDVLRRGREDIEVIVTGGKIAVQRDTTAFGATDEPAASTLVAAGEEATTRANGFQVVQIDRLNANRRLAWQSGELSFEGESLEQAVEEFNRYNRRQLEIADSDLRQLRVGGTFKATDIDSFVATLQGVFGLIAQSDAGGTLRIRRPRAQQAADSAPPDAAK